MVQKSSLREGWFSLARAGRWGLTCRREAVIVPSLGRSHVEARKYLIERASEGFALPLRAVPARSCASRAPIAS